MKNFKFLLATSFALVFVGCADNQPVPDLSKTEVKTIGGKHYAIPQGAIPGNYAVDDKVIKRFQAFGITDCKNGDVTWEDKQTNNAINEVMRDGDKKSEGIAIYKSAASEGRIGCASPLSDLELKQL